MSEPLRILIADDHEIVREGMTLLLETAPGIQVVGEASNGREALERSRELTPDVILMDLRMPEMDGLTALEHLAVDQADVAVVVLTTFNEDDLMLRALRAGAKGYLLKDTDRATLLRTIEAAGRGETLLQPEILDGALSRMETRAGAVANHEGILTDRELEVIRAAARGERTKEIAAQLHISERTVKAHLSSIFRKLDVDSRTGAVAAAARSGLLEE